MFPYILLFLLILILCFFKKEDKIFRFIMVVLFLFAALRGNGDGDYFNYKAYASHIRSIADVFNFNFPMEIGFRIIAYIVNVLKLDTQWVIGIMNAISLSAVMFFFKNNSKHKMFSILVFFTYFLQYDMHASRAAVAISLGCVAIHYLLKDDIKKYIVFCLLAMAFHGSAVILFTLLIIRTLNITFTTGIVLIGLAFLIVINFSLDATIISVLEMIGLDDMAYRYFAYTQSEQFGYPFKLYDPRLLLSIGTYILTQLIVLNIKDIKKKKEYILLNNIMLIGGLCMIILSEHTVFVTRISAYFTIISSILVPNIIEATKRYKNGKFTFFMYKLFFLLAYVLFAIRMIMRMFPYKLYIG